MHNMVTLLSIDAYAANILSTKNSTLPDESVNEKLKFYPSFAKILSFKKNYNYCSKYNKMRSSYLAYPAFFCNKSPNFIGFRIKSIIQNLSFIFNF